MDFIAIVLQVRDIQQHVLKMTSTKQIARELREIKTPLMPEQARFWFGRNGKLQSILNRTAIFLEGQKKIDGLVSSYALLVNRSYIDAALSLPPIDLAALLFRSHKGQVQDIYAVSIKPLAKYELTWMHDLTALAVSKSDTGKHVTINGDDLRIDGVQRAVVWGDARRSECSGTIQEVDASLKGKVTLRAGGSFENPALKLTEDGSWVSAGMRVQNDPYSWSLPLRFHAPIDRNDSESMVAVLTFTGQGGGVPAQSSKVIVEGVIVATPSLETSSLTLFPAERVVLGSPVVIEFRARDVDNRTINANGRTFHLTVDGNGQRKEYLSTAEEGSSIYRVEIPSTDLSVGKYGYFVSQVFGLKVRETLPQMSLPTHAHPRTFSVDVAESNSSHDKIFGGIAAALVRSSCPRPRKMRSHGQLHLARLATCRC